jgi:formylglycine-generating enzyme required for sulfatase activity
MAGEALDVFISYSRRDEGLKDELVNYHLKPLQREGKIRTWQDRDIEAGAEWAEEIRVNLERADIVLLLITRHFWASDYCYETEMQRAVQRHYEGTARVIPIILEPCGWKYSDFKQLQVLPKDGIPVTSWAKQAEAFFDVEEGIRRVVDNLNAERKQAAERVQAETERQRQQAVERLRQQQAEAERQAREQKAAEQRQREAAELLQQQQEADRQERERQAREAAERQRQQQEAAEQLERERQKQLAEDRQRQRQALAERKRLQGQTGIGRRRAMQIAGLGGGSLILTMATNSFLSERSGSSPQITEPPAASGSSPDDLSAVEIETVKVNERGNITERQQGQVSAFREDLGNSIGLDMVAISDGQFVMGSPAEEEGRGDDEGPQHTVKVPRFFMGRFQVTQAQYEAVMGKNPSNFKGADRPVESVSWDDAVAFCEKLSQRTGRTYRLPSEAEWEYACRAGTTTPFHFGPTITTDLVNFDGNNTYGAAPKGKYRGQTTDVGSFPPNAFGLYDVHGNVWEWCQDVWHSSYEGAPTDGSAWVEGDNQTLRLLRGGSWGNLPANCRSAFRNGLARDSQYTDNGFRLVCASSWAL